MHAKLSTLALLAMGGLLAAGPAGAQVHQSYTFTDLGTLGGRNSHAAEVNNTGVVVGWSTLNDNDTFRRATVWHGTTPVERQDTGMHSVASDINNRGEIVGTDLFRFPTLWDGTEVTTLPTLGSRGSASAINDRGQVAGTAALPGGGSRAVVWDGTKLTELDPLGPHNSAFDINNRGQVVGDSTLPGNHVHAVLWNGKEVTDLGTLGGNSSFANAINDRGQVAGWSSLAGDSAHHATIWNGTEATDLGTLGGGYSSANSINNAGLVVGESETASSTDANYEIHATLWADGTAIDLNGFLDAETVNEGWVLTYASGINDKGWIVGSASNDLQGIGHAFLLTPSNEGGAAMTVPKMLTTVPEPETYAMFLAGLGLIAGTLLPRRKAA